MPSHSTTEPTPGVAAKLASSQLGRAASALRRQSYRLRRAAARAAGALLADRPVRVVPADGTPAFTWTRNPRYPREMRQGCYEPEFAELLVGALAPDSRFFDVGANGGYWSLRARSVALRGAVWAFEPLPENVRMIRRVQELNPHLPFELIAAAAAAEDGTAQFVVTRNNANSRLAGAGWERQKPTESVHTVPAVALEPLIRRHRPDLVKIDVEGAEGVLLASLSKATLAECRPALLIELHGEESHHLCPRLLAERGYRIEQSTDLAEGCSHILARYRDELGKPG